MKYKIYDAKKLRDGLGKLTGADFAKAEKEARERGEQAVDIVISRTFHAVVAAKALGVVPEDIIELPIREYTVITGDVGSFLLAPELEGNQ